MKRRARRRDTTRGDPGRKGAAGGRVGRRLAAAAAALVLALAVALAVFALTRDGRRPGPGSAPVDPVEVWAAVQREAAAHRLDPGFVFAVAFAESSFDAGADSGYARGLMQVSRAAWEQVSGRPYADAWDWEANLAVGAAYLAYCRDFLDRHGQFNYPRLAACYRYGPNAVRRAGFDLRNLERPSNLTYRAIFEGNLHPVETPPNAPGGG